MILPRQQLQTTMGDDLLTPIFGASWEDGLAKQIFAETGDSALQSFWGANGWNTGLIDKMNKYYHDDILPGADRQLYISANANVSNAVAASFIKNISAYAGKDHAGLVGQALWIGVGLAAALVVCEVAKTVRALRV